jgi:heterodisulfide reductase subunit A-like polyferredoxin
MTQEQKPRFIMCICTGQCPGFASLELWELIDYVRGELDAEYAIVHPQLCVDDGDRFILDYIKPGIKYVIGACDPKMQKKMFEDAFSNAGGEYGEQVVPLDLRNMATQNAMNKVKEAIEQINTKSDSKETN